jgi:hypothetical protein
MILWAPQLDQIFDLVPSAFVGDLAGLLGAGLIASTSCASTPRGALALRPWAPLPRPGF